MLELSLSTSSETKKEPIEKGPIANLENQAPTTTACKIPTNHDHKVFEVLEVFVVSYGYRVLFSL